jgi:Flp pilus assembly protein CpaB
VSSPSIVLTVRARRALARPAVRRTFVVVLAAATVATVTLLVSAAGAARERWGTTRAVVVATRDLAPGDVVEAGAVEVRDLPAGVLGDAAVADTPEGAVVRQPIFAGEPVIASRLAPAGLTGAAALVPPGQRAVAVPVGPGGVPPVVIGDQVDVLAVIPPGAGMSGAVTATDGGPASGGDSDEPAFRLVEGATIVDVAEAAVTVAVPETDAPRVAWTLSNGALVLALAGA